MSTINLYSISGEHIQTVLHDNLRPGVWAFDIDTSILPAGQYFLVLRTPSESITRRMEVVR
jgi:hypothetical protein